MYRYFAKSAKSLRFLIQTQGQGFTKGYGQECRSLLSIGGIICNFTPIFPYFQHWGDEPRPPFSSGKQIKRRPKKRSLPKIEEFFSPNSSEDQKTDPNIIQRSDADQSQIIGGDADVDHSQIIGGMQSNYWGGISPIPPGFRHPCERVAFSVDFN